MYEVYTDHTCVLQLLQQSSSCYININSRYMLSTYKYLHVCCKILLINIICVYVIIHLLLQLHLHMHAYFADKNLSKIEALLLLVVNA